MTRQASPKTAASGVVDLHADVKLMRVGVAPPPPPLRRGSPPPPPPPPARAPDPPPVGALAVSPPPPPPETRDGVNAAALHVIDAAPVLGPCGSLTAAAETTTARPRRGVPPPAASAGAALTRVHAASRPRYREDAGPARVAEGDDARVLPSGAERRGDHPPVILGEFFW